MIGLPLICIKLLGSLLCISFVTIPFLFEFTGRNDYRNSGSRGGHASGLPRPYGGHGRGRGSYNSSKVSSTGNERQDSGFDAPRWDSVSKDGNEGWSNFPGAKVQNSPGREAFPGGWGGSGSGSGGNSWGGGGTTDSNGWGNASGSGSGSGSGGNVGGWGGGAGVGNADPKRSSTGNGWSGSRGW